MTTQAITPMYGRNIDATYHGFRLASLDLLTDTASIAQKYIIEEINKPIILKIVINSRPISLPNVANTTKIISAREKIIKPKSCTTQYSDPMARPRILRYFSI